MIDLDVYALQASDRYVAFLNNLRGQLWTALRKDPTDMRSRDALFRDVHALAVTFLDQERPTLHQAVEEVAQDALQRVALDLGVSVSQKLQNAFLTDYRDNIAHFLLQEFMTQLDRDIHQVMRKYEELGLQVFMERQTSATPEEAHFRVLMNANESMSFYFRDRSSRKLNSQKYIRTVVRHALVTVWTQLYAMEATSYSASHLTVEHPDKAKYDGLKLGFVDSQGLPTLMDVKDEIFHPQTKAYLKAHY
mgnify:CR=1 FL=1|tara:strand:- start:130 stop:876 length:747 start_codon:yes stop_codon:yes gene_type:complete